MKQTILVAAASAAIGAAVAVMLTQRPAPAPRSVAPARASNVAALEDAFTRALERVGFGRQARAVPASAVERGVPGTPRPPELRRDSPSTRGTGVSPLPAADLSALSSLSSFEKDERLRRDWMFRSEREAIEWLGTPNLVQVAQGGNERWYYNLPDGKLVQLEFNRGRLLNIWR